jgi:hypothetical protein
MAVRFHYLALCTHRHSRQLAQVKSRLAKAGEWLLVLGSRWHRFHFVLSLSATAFATSLSTAFTTALAEWKAQEQAEQIDPERDPEFVAIILEHIDPDC